MISDSHQFWALVGIVAGGVFLMRLSSFVLLGRITVTPGMRRALSFIPAAVFPALIVPAVIFKGSSPGLDPANPRLYAALVAALVAQKTGNLFVTIGSGMGTLWFLKLFILQY